MYLMYVDESGDPGTINSPTRYFILSALIVHETSWQHLLDDLILFKRYLKSRYGLLFREEIHASEFLNGKIKLKNKIPRNDRLDLLKKCLDWLNQRTDISIISVRVDKNHRSDPFNYGWMTLIQRFDNTLAYRNFPGPTSGNDKGIIISDNTYGEKLRKLLRQMRRFNQVTNMVTYGPGYRNIPLRAIIEDPVFRDSAMSFILQLVDVVAYFARQIKEPNKYIKAKGAKNDYGKLSAIINLSVTKKSSQYKIVEV
jgi:hypothetical protein